MSSRRPPQDWNDRPRDPRDPAYWDAVPGRGYAPPPDAGRHRMPPGVRADSMRWWRAKIAQGLLIGGIPVAVGLAVLGAGLLSGSTCLTLPGVLVLLGGLGVVARYLAAPLTCRWIVTVPEDRYCVVEDHEGFTVEFLEPGRMIVPWRWRSTVRDYVAFDALTVRERVPDVLGGTGPRIDLDVTVLLTFNPVEADPVHYARLRRMTSPAHFEAMLGRDIHAAIHHTLSQQPAPERVRLLYHPTHLEELIANWLAHYEPLGLAPASAQPVMVHVRGQLPPPPAADEAPPPTYAEPEPEPTQPHIDTAPMPPIAAPDSGPTLPPPRLKAPDEVIDPVVRRRRRSRRAGKTPDSRRRRDSDEA